MSEKPLSDLRVVETAAILAGPAVGLFFAELGARVTKVENKRAGCCCSLVLLLFIPGLFIQGHD